MVTKGSPSRSKISWRKPGPSSLTAIDTACSVQRASISTSRLGEVDGVLEQIAKPVGDRRIAPEHRLGGSLRLAGVGAAIDRDLDAGAAQRRDRSSIITIILVR